LKGLPGGGTSKSFEVCNNLPLNKVLNFDMFLKISPKNYGTFFGVLVSYIMRVKISQKGDGAI